MLMAALRNPFSPAALGLATNPVLQPLISKIPTRLLFSVLGR